MLWGHFPSHYGFFAGLLGVAAAILLLRRPLAGFVVCLLFGAVYVPTAIVLWNQFSFGSWAAIAAVLLAAFGVVQARNALKRTAAG